MMLRHIHIGFCLIAGLGVSVAAVTPSVAANTDGPVPKVDRIPQSDDTTTAAPKPDRGGNGAKANVNDGRSGHGLAEKDKPPSVRDSDTPQIRMKDLGAVDTRITVPPQPRRPDDNKGQNPMWRTPSGLRTQPPRIGLPGGAVSRNSIGVAIPSSARPAVRGQSQESGRGITNPAIVTRSGEPGSGPVVAPRNAALSSSQSRPSAAAPAWPRPTLNGPGIAPRINAPAVIGGPAKSLAGINGSAIRPKH